ncbi:molybdopterin molybdotransferase MoeA [Glutamicibacter sp. 287]|uniref:molybdopterin molybdotransferase MoeA n=1 Tax=unclassified Glutamicibacter TaxID=2627139 RepID=UPI000BB97BFB|nr:gephyrin-like molybdotransferase Glp [Glutamicibacter sp. BW80]PCC28783.1 molybdopterin molybdenumtransferase MoeA [Glutamicibacter sp. BW80]
MSCTLESHRVHVRDLLAPMLQRLRGEAPELLSVGHPALAGRVTAAQMTATLPIPAFTNSQMDGYALHSQQLAAASRQSPLTFPLGFTAAAGDPRLTLEPGTVIPVMTGAPIPSGADTVVPIEETVSAAFPALVRVGAGTPSGTATFTGPSGAGRFIREAGEQLAGGAVVAEAGELLTPTLIGALAASGVHQVPVQARPQVLLCTTGDELAAPGSEVAAARIPDANSPMLAALLRNYGAEVSVARLPDDPQAFSEHLLKHAAQADLLLTVGGISAGAFEVVRQVLEPLGGDFHHVAMQPGGPQGHARLENPDGSRTPVLCFPGNPVSALLSAELFLAPLLRAFAALPQPQATRGVLAHEVSSPGSKHQVRRAMLADGQVTVLAPGSHLIHDLARADALVHLPVGLTHLPAGAEIETWSFNV